MLRYILISTLMVLNLGMSASAAPTASRAMAARRSPVMPHEPEPILPYFARANLPRPPIDIKGPDLKSPRGVVPNPPVVAAVPASLAGRQTKNPSIPMGPSPEADVPAGLRSRQMEKNHDWSGHPQTIPATQPDPQPAQPEPAPASPSDPKPVAARQLSALGMLSGAGAPTHNANASPNANAKNTAPSGSLVSGMAIPNGNGLPGAQALPVPLPVQPPTA